MQTPRDFDEFIEAAPLIGRYWLGFREGAAKPSNVTDYGGGVWRPMPPIFPIALQKGFFFIFTAIASICFWKSSGSEPIL